jgi:pyruvate dehydrogenase E1 component
MKLVPDQIARWVPGGLFSLGTDGFGRSDTRETMRRFFEIDAESLTVATLYRLSLDGKVPASKVKKAISDLGIDPEKVDPLIT